VDWIFDFRTLRPGHRLLVALKIRRMTQQQLFKITGIARATICEYASGLVTLSQDQKEKIRTVLDLPEGFLE